MAHPILFLIAAIAALPLLLTGMVLAAIFPYFLLGAIGQLWWKRQLRKEPSQRREANVNFFEEKQLWLTESKSLAETLAPTAGPWQEAG